MFAPLNLELIRTALASRNGWIELGVILACFVVGWAIDRRLHVSSSGESRMAKIGAGGVNRLIFPLATLALLLMVRGSVTKFYTPAFFPIAVPLVIALAAIRLSVYALRNLFGDNHPLPAFGARCRFHHLGWAAALLPGHIAGDRQGSRGSRNLHRTLEHQPARTCPRCADRDPRADDLALGVRVDRAMGAAHAQPGPQRPRGHGEVLPRGAADRRGADFVAIARHRPDRPVGVRRRARRRHRAGSAEAREQLHRRDSRSCSTVRFGWAT